MSGKAKALVIVGLGLVTAVAVTRGAGQPGAAGPPAQVPGLHRTAVLDLVRIFEECAQIKDLNAQMGKARQDYVREVEQRQQSLKAKETELIAFKVGTDDFRRRRDDLMRMRIQSTVWAEVTEAGLEQRMFDWTALIHAKAVEATRQIANDRGYDVVLQHREIAPERMAEQRVQNLRRAIQGQAVVCHTAQVDITNLVLARMDAEYRAARQAPAVGARP